MNNLSERLRILREKKGLLLRQVAATLEVDTAYVSKLERGEKNIRKEHLLKLAALYEVKVNDLLTLWLSERVMEVIYNEPDAKQALQMVIQNLEVNG